MNKVLTTKYILLFLFLLTAGITIYSKFLSPVPVYTKPANLDENFDESLLSINSSARLDSATQAFFKRTNYDTARTVIFIDNFLRNRFYHSYSHLTLRDNWIAVFCGYTFWHHFLYPVAPGDIIEYPMAACSQQGIIFQEQLAHLRIPCSTIQFFPLTKMKPGHYAVSVYYYGSWHYYDSNREPYIVDSTMPSIEKIIATKLYEQMYSRPGNIEFQDFFKNKSYKRVDTIPFSKGKMYYFQMTAGFLSNWLWLFLLLAFALVSWLQAKKK